LAKVLEIRVGPAADALDRFEAAWNRKVEGRPVKTLSVLTLPTLARLVKTLSPARWALDSARLNRMEEASHCAPGPSRQPGWPVPASVVTTPSGVTLRMAWLPVSAT